MNLSEGMDRMHTHTSSLENQFNYRPMRGHCVYFIGIGGIGMSAVARILLKEGCVVAGSGHTAIFFDFNTRGDGRQD